jgi:ketosteroid isomerase-like protein
MTSFTSHTRDLIQILSGYEKVIGAVVALSLGIATTDLNASSNEDVNTVAALDAKYQAAVKSNDAATMDQILADDFVLVTGRGKVSSKADLIESARKKEVTYERQDEEPGTQKVRVWGDTAVVTALLWIKAEQGGKPADYKLWFSDTYVRTPTGWRYVFGQASLPLPKTESK